MREAGVPCAPGYLGERQDDATLAAMAAELGLPLLVKAVAGGGGRGMRLVRQMDELPEALAGARREAHSAFGDGAADAGAADRTRPPHRGTGLRRCARQRHPPGRARLHGAAPPAEGHRGSALAGGQPGAARGHGPRRGGRGAGGGLPRRRHGGVHRRCGSEALLPGDEHPAAGRAPGHRMHHRAGPGGVAAAHRRRRAAAAAPGRQCASAAMPSRRGCMPKTRTAASARRPGRVAWWRPQRALQAGVRIDHGIAEGGEVTPFYDAMVAKFIVHGRDRADALRRLACSAGRRALAGPENNGRFLRDLLQPRSLRRGADAHHADRRLGQRGRAAAAGAAAERRGLAP